MESELKRFKLTLEFDGSRYRGWQKQDDAKTIQGSILAAAVGLFNAPVELQGCGRTDAGVHGLRYVAHLETSTALGPQAVGRQLDSLLPDDICVLECKKAGPRFHARHNCIARSYLYQIARRRSAFCHRYTWQHPEPLEIRTMQEAGSLLIGLHDFSSFTDRQVLKKKSPMVMINKLMVVESGDLILIRLVGSHFLWKMVRRVVGALAKIGEGRLSGSELAGYLEHPVDLKQLTAPPQGLFLERAFYDQEELDGFLAATTPEAKFF